MSKELISIIQNNKSEDEIITYLTSGDYNKKLINTWDQRGNTPLILCTNRNMEKAVKEILNLKPKVNITNVFGISALHWASNDANSVILKMLIENGANYNLVKNFFSSNQEGDKVKAPLTFMLDYYKHQNKSRPWIERALVCADVYISLAKDRGQAKKFLNQIKDSNEQSSEIYKKLEAALTLLVEKYTLEEKIEMKNSSSLVSKL